MTVSTSAQPTAMRSAPRPSQPTVSPLPSPSASDPSRFAQPYVNALEDFLAAYSRADEAAAVLGRDVIEELEVIDFAHFGMEAVFRITVRNFPAFVVIDDKGNDFFARYKPS